MRWDSEIRVLSEKLQGSSLELVTVHSSFGNVSSEGGTTWRLSNRNYLSLHGSAPIVSDSPVERVCKGSNKRQCYKEGDVHGNSEYTWYRIIKIRESAFISTSKLCLRVTRILCALFSNLTVCYNIATASVGVFPKSRKAAICFVISVCRSVPLAFIPI